MNIVFFGSGAFGLPTLEALAKEHTVSAVVSQPDKPAGRKRILTPTPISKWAAEQRLPLKKPANVNEPETLEALRSIRADAWVVIAFGQKLSPELLDGIFAVNLHASLLPRWRGAAPINHAILAGDAVTGNSVITLADRMDAGLVLGQSQRGITTAHTTASLHDELSEDGPELVLDVLDRRIRGTLEPVTQDESLVTLAGKLTKETGYIGFDRPADEVRRHIHGLNAWPSVTVEFRGERVKLHPAVNTDMPSTQPPGTVEDPAAGLVATADTLLRLETLQPAGKAAMPWADFANGLKPERGELFTPVSQQSVG